MIEIATDEPAIKQRRFQEVRNAYARGWDLIPLAGKRPSQKQWQSQPPLPIEDVLRHAEHGNVGLRTGGPSRLVVLDDDTADLSIAATLALPPTVTVVTGSGKRHYYFHCDEPLGNSRGRLPIGVDVRGQGGQIVYPGSLHPDTNRAYDWLAGHSPDEIAIATLPPNVLALIRKEPPSRVRQRAPRAALDYDAANAPPLTDIDDRESAPRPAKRIRGKRRRQATGRLASYANETLSGLDTDVATAIEGSRNTTLNRAAFRAGRLVGLELLDREVVESVLATAGLEADLPEAEVASTIRCGLDSGIAQCGTIEDLLAELDANTLGLPPADEDQRLRPLLALVDGERHHAVDDVLEVLRQQDPPIIFEQLGRLVCLTPAVFHHRRRSASRGVSVRTLDDVYLSDLLGRMLRFRKQTPDGSLVPVNCPPNLANTVISRAPHAGLSALAAVICTPTLRPDGSLLATPGYDRETGVYLDIEPGAFSGVPEHPTRADALRALADLKEPFDEFKFETDADRSVFLAALLTPFVRWHLRTAPMFVFSAPRRGSGKTLLARAVALIATGRSPWTLAQEHTEEESRKRWFAVLLAGANIVNIDNLEAPLGGATLCTLLTEELLTDRVLGVSQVQSVDTTKLVLLATGNNVEIAGDLTRRVLICGIDPEVEFPEDRTFKRNLDRHLLDNRPGLVVAALTLLRAFIAAGRPPADVRPFGSFEEWSDLVRATLIWAGEPDPCRNRKVVEESDPSRELAEALISAWIAAFDGAELTAAQLIATVGGESLPEELLALAAALRPICGTGSAGYNAVALGRWLRRICNRVQSGYRVEVASRAHGTVRWRVRRV